MNMYICPVCWSNTFYFNNINGVDTFICVDCEKMMAQHELLIQHFSKEELIQNMQYGELK
jgi:hypothetical protein